MRRQATAGPAWSDADWRRPHAYGRAALWVLCLAIVVALHLAFFLRWNHAKAPPGEAPLPPAVTIDLAPLPAPPAPAAPPNPTPPKPVPPPPKPVVQPPKPVTPPPIPATPPPTPKPPVPQPLAPPLTPPPPIDLPVAESDATLPMPPPPPPPPPPRQKPRHLLRKAVTVTQQPPPDARPDPKAVPAPAAPAASASDASQPTPVQQSAAAGAARQDWQSRLLAHIAEYKHYPQDAQDSGWEGTSLVRFSFRRDGKVVSVTLVQGSGHAALDEAAIATLHRASPLPAPPESVPGDPVTLTVPLQFSLDRD